MAMNVEAEIRDLKRRVSGLEGSCGEGTFGFLVHQISDLHKDLLAFQEKTEQRFDKVDGRFVRSRANSTGWKARSTVSIVKSTPKSTAWRNLSRAS